MVVQEQPQPMAQTMQPNQPQQNPNELTKEEKDNEDKKTWTCTLKRSALLKRFCNDYKDDPKQSVHDDDLRAEVAAPQPAA
ncbi:hypothetical protein K4K57_007337 [Colletotrichum sp. SAR 10_99]|nr:hypothetical protein K4K57_007337 [Colletotrichum sp. SAR 10_99]